MEVTVNYLLAMEKSLRDRLRQLDELKTQSARRSSLFLGNDEKRIEEPTYDIKKVDRKITAINRALFEINHKVKESNAMTKVAIAADYNELVSELE